MRAAFALAAAALLSGCSPTATDAPAGEGSLPPPLSVVELSERDFDTALTRERDLDGGPSFGAYLVSYRHSGLKLHALVAVPRADAPAAGFPVLLANHGYVPEPKMYGITAEGVDSRPGDYYRAVPELFASRGFIVVMPDYRGHSSSEGYEYIDPQDEHSAAYYAEDVVALLFALDDLEDADTDRLFMWSHSMGGIVSLRALLATDSVRAASFWSTMSVDDLHARLADLDGPVIVHHSVDDTAAPFGNSVRLADALEAIGHPHRFHRYAGDAHFFDHDDRQVAADRDAALFLAQ